MTNTQHQNPTGATVAEAEAFLQKHPEIEAFDIVLHDSNGVGRGKIIRRNELIPFYTSGRHMPVSVMGLDICGLLRQNPYHLVVIIDHLFSDSCTLNVDGLVVRSDFFLAGVVGNDDGIVVFKYPPLFSIYNLAFCSFPVFYHCFEIMLG